MLGIALALLLAWLINHAGLTWSPPGQVDPSPILVRVWGEWRMMAVTAGGLMAMALLSSWWRGARGGGQYRGGPASCLRPTESKGEGR